MSLLLAFHPRVASASASGSLSATGSSSTTFVGAARTAGALSSVGAGAVSFVGQARAGAVISITGAGAASFVGNTSARGALSAIGAGSFQAGGRSTASGALSITGAGSVTFSGSTGGTVASGALFVAASTPITGLDFPSNGDSPSLARIAFRFTGSVLPDIVPLTIIWRYYPVQHTGFHTTFFHGQSDGGFSGGPDYFGCHPYPQGGSSGTVHNWEVSANGADEINDVNGNSTVVVKDQWYRQAAVAQNLTSAQIDFWWDLATSSGRRIRSTLTGFTLANSVNSPELIFGDATWAPATERMSGLFRGLQIYQGVLTESQIEQLSPLETDAAVIAKASDLGLTLFYCNINPTQADITDKSGNGRDPSWQDVSNKATDWSGTAAGAALVAFAGNAVVSSALSVTGSSSSTFAGASRSVGAVTAVGAGTASLVGQARVAGAIKADGAGSANFVGSTAADAAGALSATGQATASFSGSAIAAGALNVQGSSTVSFGGASLAGGALRSDSGGEADFVGAQAAAGAAAMAANGAGAMLVAGSSVAAGAFVSVSGADAVFAGGSTQPAAMFSVSGASVAFSSENVPVPEVEETPSQTAGGGAGRLVYDMVRARRKRRQEAQEQRDLEDVVALIELIESHGMKRAA